MFTALQELDFDVVCIVWDADDLNSSLDPDAQLVTWLLTAYTLLVRLSLGLVTGCQLRIQAPHSRNSMHATMIIVFGIIINTTIM